MKPWEETWAWALEKAAGYDCMTDAYVVRSSTTCHRFDIDCGRRGASPEAESLVRLLAAAPAMARLLLKLEWAGAAQVGPGDGCDATCPSCGGAAPGSSVGPPIGHAIDCELVAVLRAAGVVE